MNQEALVTIIAPMFNGESYIERFIKCIQCQTYPHWELIFVDDGSTDDSVRIVKNWLQDDSRIKLIERKREPKGSVTCRNIGQAAMHGDFFIHLDSDDIVQPFMIEQRLRFMREHPDIDYATARGESVAVNQGATISTGRQWGIDPQKDLLSCFLEVDYPFSVWNNIYRTSTMGEYYWDERVKIYTDFSYIVPCIISGYRHAFIEGSDVDYLYIIGQKNAMTSNFIAQDKYESTKYLFSKTLKLIEDTDKPAKYKKAFRKFFALQVERVSMDGSQEQIDDFYSFYCSNYTGRYSLRFRMLYKAILSKAKEKHVPSKKLRLYIYLFLKPKDLFGILSSKMRGRI